MEPAPLSAVAPAVGVFTEAWHAVFPPDAVIRRDDVEVALGPDGSVSVRADTTPLTFLRLRWNVSFATSTRFLGDAWERSYGDLQWRGMDPSRWMPWHVLAQDRGVTRAFGVKVRPAAFAMWSVDPDGITLWLDLRSGTRGVVLGGRTLHAADVLSATYESLSPFAAAHAFCAEMSPAPLPVPFPIYGSNNWYYAYGKSSREDILGDCRVIADLCDGLENRPFMVVDEGWDTRAGHGLEATRWSTGNERFGDMADLAGAMRAHGVRPGIWIRPLEVFDPSLPTEWTLHTEGASRFLDPSVPEVLDLVRRDIRRLSDWGYRLVKHDFSTYDIFLRWGFAMREFPAEPAVRFTDRFRTTAEIIQGLYRAILDGAGPETLVLGCNTVSHLAAGLVHAARTGDDTSGRNWERTRRMGVNTLAFRLPQHRHFYEADADCVGIRGDIPMSLNLQWAELLARSGTVFFASVKPGILTPPERRTMRRLFALASTQRSVAEPLDWMRTTTPERWRFDGRARRFHWQGPDGETPEFASPS